ncbi:MAG TPA: bifunctional homocysteine S-methyltransferase/methylenetetrahydrofolate reductase [Vicinamibacteria bacterium]|nr:bifunctional homocysteine S-methyltransferase/methylenetetrahydrofolate reductase [Vicinamibacteria bacterium]
MNRSEFRSRLESSPLVCDGAMGTSLYAKGVMVNRCFDELNCSNPTLVKSIHRDYLTVGVDIIETNTYGANRFKLQPHGFGDRVRIINEKGVEIAREAADYRAVLVAGAVGPLGKPIAPIGTVPEEDAFDAFHEQAEALVRGGADLILLETFSDLRELTQAVRAVRSVSTEVPVVAQMTFGDDGATPLGAKPENVARTLNKLDVDAVGANCSVGPELMLRVAERMASSTSLPLSVQPNAGLPEVVEGRVLYLCSPEYMAHYAKLFLRSGVSIIGGCCGTTASHIGAVVGVVRSLGLSRSAVEVSKPLEPRVEHEPVARERKSRLAKSLGRKFVVSVEMDPPKGAEPGLLVEKALWLKDNEVDFINVGDGPRASARMSALSFAVLLEQRVGIETILHYQCRDRNLIGIQGDLLGAHALGLRNVLAVTGDPPKLGDYPYATAVFDVDSVGLVRILSRLNRGLDLAGNPLGSPLPFHIGVGANPGSTDIEAELAKFERKVSAGAEFCLTQPVYQPSYLERFLKGIEPFRIPVLVGILPLVSFRNAEFLHNEVPGMAVPAEVRERLKKAPTNEAAQDVGVDIARDALRAARDLADGAYLMPPFNRFELAARVIDGIV